MDLEKDTLLARRFKVLGKHSPLFYDRPLQLVRGEGVWVYDIEGKRYLDAYNNVPHVGHCHPRVVQALKTQASTLNTHTRYLHENIVQYAERLTAKFDDTLSTVMFTCTGSEANELALRMARLHTGEQGIIVTDYAYHGNTEAVAELGTAFMPEASSAQRVRSIPIPDSYRGLKGVDADALADSFADSVTDAIESLAKDGIGLAGMLICPDFANEGLVNAPSGFVEKAMVRVHAAGGLYIADEVQGGFGRTGQHWWSHEAEGAVPDIVTLGKPMGNGHPLAGVVARTDLVDEFGEWGLYFNTFAGNPVSCAVGMAVLDVLEEEQLLDNAVQVGNLVADGLRELQGRYDIIGDVRHKGLFFALELVEDRTTKSPATNAAKRLVNGMCERGVLISRVGRFDNILKLRPPMPFSRDNAELLVSTLNDCLMAL